MRQKSHIKHTEKKSVPDLFPAAAGAKSLASPWSTAAALSPHPDLDAPALRRRAREINPATGKPWIPAPRGARWEVIPTLLGLIAWYRHQLTRAAERGLPAQCASMRDTETVYGFPIEMQSYAREHHHPKTGEQVIFESSNRVNIPPLLAFFRPLFQKIFCKGGEAIKGIEDFEGIDLDTQRALSAQQDVIQKKRDNALAAQQLNTRAGVEKEIAEPLTNLAAAWKNYEKNTGGKLKSLLTGAGVPPEIVRQAITIATAGIQEPITKLREQLQLTEAVGPSSESKKAA